MVHVMMKESKYEGHRVRRMQSTNVMSLVWSHLLNILLPSFTHVESVLDHHNSEFRIFINYAFLTLSPIFTCLLRPLKVQLQDPCPNQLI